jgi:hypothetical protein
MSEPTQDSQDRGWNTYTFVCPRCGASVTISLKATNVLLRCRCGAYFGEAEHPDRPIVNAPIGDRDRSGATLAGRSAVELALLSS